MRPDFLPPISRGGKRRLLPMIPEDQASVFGWAVDGDPSCVCLRSLGLRQNDLESAVLERGLDLVFLDAHAGWTLPFEATRGARFAACAVRHVAIRFRLNPIALFCFCLDMAAEPVSFCEDYFQST
jgi:hypothetical protein